MQIFYNEHTIYPDFDVSTNQCLIFYVNEAFGCVGVGVCVVNGQGLTNGYFGSFATGLPFRRTKKPRDGRGFSLDNC